MKNTINRIQSFLRNFPQNEVKTQAPDAYLSADNNVRNMSNFSSGHSGCPEMKVDAVAGAKDRPAIQYC